MEIGQIGPAGRNAVVHVAMEHKLVEELAQIHLPPMEGEIARDQKMTLKIAI